MANWRYVPQLNRFLNLNKFCSWVRLQVLDMAAPLCWASKAPLMQAATWMFAVLQVVGVYGSWHLGQLQVGLSRAKRLCQCSRARIITKETLPMQVCSLLRTLPVTCCDCQLLPTQP